MFLHINNGHFPPNHLQTYIRYHMYQAVFQCKAYIGLCGDICVQFQNSFAVWSCVESYKFLLCSCQVRVTTCVPQHIKFHSLCNQQPMQSYRPTMLCEKHSVCTEVIRHAMRSLSILPVSFDCKLSTLSCLPNLCIISKTNVLLCVCEAQVLRTNLCSVTNHPPDNETLENEV